MYQVVMPLWRYLVYSRGLFPAYLGSIWAKSDFEGLVLLIFNCQGAKVETIYHIYKTPMLCLQENESSQNNQAGTSIEISMVASILLFLNNCSFRSINLTKDIEALAVITSETVRGCGGLASLSLGEAFTNGSWSGTRCRMGRLAKNGESTVSTSYLEDCLLVLLDCELDWSWMDACNSSPPRLSLSSSSPWVLDCKFDTFRRVSLIFRRSSKHACWRLSACSTWRDCRISESGLLLLELVDCLVVLSVTGSPVWVGSCDASSISELHMDSTRLSSAGTTPASVWCSGPGSSLGYVDLLYTLAGDNTVGISTITEPVIE